MTKLHLLGTAIALALTASAQAADVKVINDDAWFAEGPIWYQDKLFYVEYGRNTVDVWDGKKNEIFWKMDGCGPSAVLPTAKGEFVVTCYDSNSIGRISADGKTLDAYDKDKDGKPFSGPNDFAPDKDGGIYFTGSGKGGAAIDASAYYIGKDGSVAKVADDLHNANGLVMSNDGKILYLVETEDNRIIEFDVAADHSLSTGASSCGWTTCSRTSRISGRTASRWTTPARCISARARARSTHPARSSSSIRTPSFFARCRCRPRRCRTSHSVRTRRNSTSWPWTRSTLRHGTARSMRYRTSSRYRARLIGSRHAGWMAGQPAIQPPSTIRLTPVM
ncbi:MULTISPECIES: SMP-30/gluconolactonase/LRE family protein [unclassified Mesorhizobium]|uniref:SMP-30/gluconolactonase/LRE family protein n=1 Tax=unclassified Mesorhizobium TaxID=325217 RepID=UPI00112D723D|nr:MULTISPECIES: SMP-30/gluconolactonase/LRE family protein [unclassified Mesorhizobium]TPM29448.1 SMP-30/gluconolactonase/LRE family protein [Mesorhizobium sp. B2-2-2]